MLYHIFDQFHYRKWLKLYVTLHAFCILLLDDINNDFT